MTVCICISVCINVHNILEQTVIIIMSRYICAFKCDYSTIIWVIGKLSNKTGWERVCAHFRILIQVYNFIIVEIQLPGWNKRNFISCSESEEDRQEQPVEKHRTMRKDEDDIAALVGSKSKVQAKRKGKSLFCCSALVKSSQNPTVESRTQTSVAVLFIEHQPCLIRLLCLLLLGLQDNMIVPRREIILKQMPY